MQEIANKKICSGCHACCSICPKHCIEMIPDSEGFYYPETDEQKCIDCKMCKRVCPILNEHTGNKGRAYACINKDENVRIKSSSGGIFTLIAEDVLRLGGVVFGAAFDDELNVYHTDIKSSDDLEKLRGSKYLQSRIGDAYKKAKEYLDKGQTVLFTGTPCQISGLKSYLGKEYDNLITLDFICHGAPSPQVWQKYLEYLSLIENKKINRNYKPEFRDKSTGWQKFSMSVFFEGGKRHTQTLSDDLYMKAFLKDLILRPSCYNCHSKSLERESDITLADFWGIENILPEMFDNKGTSLVLINSLKGQKMFDIISDKMRYKAVDINEAVKYNTAAYKSCAENKNRDKFMNEITAENFDKVVKKYTKQNFIKRCLVKIKRIIKRMCR